MFQVVAVVLVLAALASLWTAARAPGVLTMFVATFSLFSVGYYALPLLLPNLSALGSMPERDIDAVAVMVFLYLLCIVIGLSLVARSGERMPRLRLPHVDRLATAHWWPVTLLAAAGYVTYLRAATLTSYEAADFNAFFEVRSPLFGLIGFFSSAALAILAVNFAIAIRAGHRWRIAVMLLLFGYIEVRLVGGAQRLLFITPIFMIFVSLVGMRQYRVAGSALLAGVLALLIVSPFAVALRSTRTGGHSSELTAASVSYHEGFLRTTLQSIVDRSDLIYNMTYLKPYVDSHGFAGPLFYESVLVIPIPRLLIPGKPYELSDTGEPDGEASTLAWNIIVGHGIGSLTAFGPIVAYREGGWLAVIIDGLADGMLFALTLGIFSRSGYTGRVFLPMAFVAFTVAKVPPSFFESLAQILTYLPILLGLWLLDTLIGAASRRGTGPVRRESLPSAS